MHWRSSGQKFAFARTLVNVAANAAVVFSLLAAWSPSLPAQAGGGESLLDQGFQRFREGNYLEAIRLFEQAFAAEPDNDAIYDFIERATPLEILRMARSDDPRIAGIGRKLLELRRGTLKRRTSDPDEIRAAIEETFAAAPQERLVKQFQYTTRFGRNLVPYLIPKLADADVNVRTDGELWIARIGLDATPPLAAAWNHPDPLVRTSVARLLGVKSLRDDRLGSLGFAILAALYRNDPEPVVRQAAAEALRAVKRIPANQDLSGLIREAKYYLLDAAMAFYLNPHLNPFHAPYYEPTIYHLKGDQVEGEKVADFQLGERMAEQVLVMALKLDPAFTPAWELAICNDAMQLVEYREGLKLYAEDAEVKALLDSQADAMETIRAPRLMAYPRELIFSGLGLALDQRMNEVAEKILETIHKTQRRGAIHRAIEAALMESSSRPVRVRAAIALADWTPPDIASSTAEMVVSVLSEAVVNSGIRIAHKIMGNSTNVNRFDLIFQQLNLESYSNSEDVEAGIQRAGQLPPDILFIDDEIRSATASQGITPINYFIKKIRENPRTAAVPIVVLAAPARLEQARQLYENPGDPGTGRGPVRVAASDSDRLTIKNTVVDPLFENLDDAKTRAIEIATAAAEALERMSARPGGYPMVQVVEELVVTLPNRPDSIRIPCLGVLGNLRQSAFEKVGAIAQLFAAVENTVEVREASMMAVGKILDGGRGAAPDSVLKIIHDGMGENDIRLREASWFAYSAVADPRVESVQRLFETPPSPPSGDSGGAATADPSGAANP